MTEKSPEFQSSKSFFDITQEKEIQKLENEIQQLEFLLQKRKDLLNSHFEKKNNVDKSPKTVFDYRERCHDLEKRIKLTAKLSGIVIEKLEEYRLPKTEDIVQYTIAGHCKNIRFKVEFSCFQNNGMEGAVLIVHVPANHKSKDRIDNEAHVDEEDCSLQVLNLDICVPEDLNNELQKDLLRISESRSIWAFFQLLIPYSEWAAHRQNIFDHFKKKYPDHVEVVTQDKISHLKISSEKSKNSFTFFIQWHWDVDQVYRVKPKLSLSAKIPEYIVKQDKNNRFTEAPERFKDMVEELGIEHAIDTIVNLVAHDVS